MQNEIYSQELRTICNAVIQIGDIDDTGKGRHFVSKFIQDGLVKIEGHGIVLLKKETIDQSLQSMVGAPVIIKHQDVTNENADELRCGVISKAYFNDFDGWYYCEGIIWDEKAKELVNNGWSVSCSYDFLAYNDEGGVENNIKYDKEFTQLNFTHLAIVDNPRYERANIVFNCKVNNFSESDVNRDKLGRFAKFKELHDKYNIITPENYKIVEQNLPAYTKLLADMTEYDGAYNMNIGYRGNSQNVNEFLRSNIPLEEFSKIKTSGNSDLFTKGYQDAIKHTINALDESMSVIKEPLTLYRFDTNVEFFGVDKDENLKEGMEFTYKPFLSTSLDDKKNVFTNRKYKSTINFPAGNRAYISDNFEESEIILPRNTRLRIEKILKDNENYLLNLSISSENITNNSKEQDMKILDELKKLISKVENEKGEQDMDEKEKVDNEQVDKRKLIDEVAGIMKSAGCDDEDIRTAIGKMEKIGYDKSEAGSADNKKVKNEEPDKKEDVDNEKDEKDEKDEKEEDKKDEKVDNEDEEDKEKVKEVKEEVKEDVDNKCKNSKSSFDKINEIYNSVKQIEKETGYVSRQQKLDNAVEYFK